MIKSTGRYVLALIGVMSASVCSAAMITLNGNHFSVTYDDSLVGLYGNPSLLGGDTIVFTPTNFKVSSTGAQVTQSAGLSLSLMAHSGYVLTDLSIQEGGDYYRMGGGLVNVGGSLSATNLSNNSAAMLALVPSAPLSAVTSLLSFRTTNWDMIGNLSLLGLGGVANLGVDLNNTLTASATGGIGFIEKKFVGLRIAAQQGTPPAAVPEPGSLMLLAAGLLAAWGLRLRETCLSAAIFKRRLNRRLIAN